MASTLKIILPVRSIPVESTVVKKTGEKLYTVLDQLVIYPVGGGRQVIKAEEGTRFIVPKSNGHSINCVSGDTEMIWLANAREVRELLDESYESDS